MDYQYSKLCFYATVRFDPINGITAEYFIVMRCFLILFVAVVIALIGIIFF